MLTAMTPSTAVAYDNAQVVFHPDVPAMARAAADQAASLMRSAVEDRGVAHVMFATGNSQLAFTELLVTETDNVPWSDTIVFHMDEYLGVGPDHPAGFKEAEYLKVIHLKFLP